jgi:DNA-binding beta-propeller fold protein YncE
VEETSGLRAELVRIDRKTGKRLAAFTIGRAGPDFGAAASSGAFVWAAAGNHVIRVDANSPGAVKRAALPGEVAAVTVGHGGAWVATIGQGQDTVTRLDPSTLAVRAHIRVTMQPVALEAWLGVVWLASTDGLWRIDPANDHLVPAPVAVAMPVRLALAGNRLWVIEQDRLVIGVDRTGHIRAGIVLPFAPGAVAATPGRIWVTDNCGCRTGKLALLDARTHRLLADRPIGETPVDVAADRSGAWVATFADRTVSSVRPSS